MNWRIAEHPEGGTIIKHLDTPRFTARWTTGEFPLDQVRDGALFWTDEGSGAEDAIHVHGSPGVTQHPRARRSSGS